MSQRRIRIPNIRLIDAVRTFLNADYTTGTSITVINNDGFLANTYAIAGNIGENLTEAVLVTGTSTSVTINIAGGYNFAHNKTTPIFRSDWNQISLERKPTNGTFSQLALLNIQWDQADTLYTDTSGDDTYSYRFRYYNSAAGIYSEYSPTIAGSGFTRQQVGTMIYNVRRKIRDPNKARYKDQEIIVFLQDGQRQIELDIPKLWFLMYNAYEEGNGIAATASTPKYSLAQYTDLNYLDKMKYLYINGANTLLWDLELLPEQEFDRYTYNQNYTPDDNVRRMKLLPPDTNSAIGYFRTFPTPLSTGVGTFYPVYFRRMGTLNDVSDTTELPFPEILEDYAAWRLHHLMGNTQQAALYKDLFYGPDDKDIADRPITGLALLKQYNRNKNNIQLGYGRSLVRFRGRKGRDNFFGNGIVSRDYLKENYW